MLKTTNYVIQHIFFLFKYNHDCVNLHCQKTKILIIKNVKKMLIMKKSLIKPDYEKPIYRLTLDDGNVIKIHRHFGKKFRLMKSEYYQLRNIISSIPLIVRHDFTFYLDRIGVNNFLIVVTKLPCFTSFLVNCLNYRFLLVNLRTYISSDGLQYVIPINPDYLPF